MNHYSLKLKLVPGHLLIADAKPSHSTLAWLMMVCCATNASHDRQDCAKSFDLGNGWRH
jgi:hypothetical protein